MFDNSNLYYYGNSQGGIEGGLTTAVAPDFTRAVLGVTGIDYGNMLIQRSSDFTPFKQILDSAYPDPSLYPLITDLMQQLWDRGDPDGYAAYMTISPAARHANAQGADAERLRRLPGQRCSPGWLRPARSEPASSSRR